MRVAYKKKTRYYRSRHGAGEPSTNGRTQGCPMLTKRPVQESDTVGTIVAEEEEEEEGGRGEPAVPSRHCWFSAPPACVGASDACICCLCRYNTNASYDYEPPTTGFSISVEDCRPAVALQQEDMRLFHDRLYAIEIALGLAPGGQAAAQSGKQGALEDLRAEVQGLRHEIRDLHDRVGRRAAVGEVLTLRQEVYPLRSELRALRGTWPYGYPPSYGSHAYVAPPMGHQDYVAPAAELRPHAPWSYDQRGYPPAYREPAPASAGHPSVSETPSRFEVIQSPPLDPDLGHLGQTSPADRDTA
ncbi:unnamed protein product [Phytophthora fragariaefolia]|uniref:Unnamed protein product n=1 Tax=Phytophthora fragariaefolia TaxID=1490495 RepID=A0A9W6Y0T9_9STRA|nr:unnamed protein product [Phytophthora fragariaefolia]